MLRDSSSQDAMMSMKGMLRFKASTQEDGILELAGLNGRGTPVYPLQDDDILALYHDQDTAYGKMLLKGRLAINRYALVNDVQYSETAYLYLQQPYYLLVCHHDPEWLAAYREHHPDSPVIAEIMATSGILTPTSTHELFAHSFAAIVQRNDPTAKCPPSSALNL